MIEIDGIKYERGLTHPGVFHADDVFATALLKRIDPDFVVERGPVPEDTTGVLVFDTGGGEFDHHGRAAKSREDGTPYSSFGLLWEKLGDRVVDSLDVAKVADTLVKPIDLADNGKAPNPLSSYIANLHAGVSGAENMNRMFEHAVDMASNVLEAEVHATNLARENVKHMEQLMEEQKGSPVLVMDEYVDGWQTSVIGSDYAFVVFPSIRGGYNTQGVPPEQGSFDQVVPFPESWRGLSGDALSQASGIETATFCHAGGFLCATETLDDAKLAAEKALQMHYDMVLSNEETDKSWLGFDKFAMNTSLSMDSDTAKANPDDLIVKPDTVEPQNVKDDKTFE